MGDFVAMPIVFVDPPPTAEQMDSLASFFDGMKDAPSIPEKGSIGVVLAAITKGLDLIFTKSETDIKAFFAEFSALLQKLSEKDKDLPYIVSGLLEAATKETGEQSKLRLSILNSFYNLFRYDSNFRCEIFLNILQYSIASELTKAVVPVLDQVDRLLQEWNATPQQKRDTYKAIVDVLGNSNPNSMKLFENQKKFLKAIEDTEDMSVAAEVAVSASVLAMKLDEIHQVDDLLELKAVQHLASVPEHKTTFELLKIFCEGNLNSFEEFVKTNSSTLGDLGLSFEDFKKKMRLLSLSALSNGQTALKYSQIADCLQIGSEEVEYWVISAISANIIDAKIDQANEQVFIRRSTQRVFDASEWKSLQTTLHSWKENVQALLVNLQEKEAQKK